MTPYSSRGTEFGISAGGTDNPCSVSQREVGLGERWDYRHCCCCLLCVCVFVVCSAGLQLCCFWAYCRCISCEKNQTNKIKQNKKHIFIFVLCGHILVEFFTPHTDWSLTLQTVVDSGGDLKQVWLWLAVPVLVTTGITAVFVCVCVCEATSLVPFDWQDVIN